MGENESTYLFAAFPALFPSRARCWHRPRSPRIAPIPRGTAGRPAGRSVLDSLLSKRWQTSGRVRAAIWRGPLQGTKLYPLPPLYTKLF